MAYLLRGALIEYKSDFLGPLPNVVNFQFNPESLTRNIQIPARPTGAASRETNQAGEVPVETISLTAHFSAADRLSQDDSLARLFGIGPQLAALERMVRPTGKISGMVGEVIDAIGDAIFGGGDECPTQPVPREQYPRILFIWGLTRVLPVVIDSMSVTEQHFDPLLNPIQAEVALGLSVMTVDPSSDDDVARGALEYSTLKKEEQAIRNLAKKSQTITNLANTASRAADLIPF
jgi:hypothetical protein